MTKKLLMIMLAVTAVTTLPLQAKEAADSRPNILLVMVDDLGFADFGCYGSEIKTPHIDTLAENGLRFSQFYNTAKCHSSRVSLLTGLYCRQAGSSSLSRGVTIAEVLAKAGYTTSMTGKWHLKGEPTDRGFEKYFGHLSGATDFFIGDKTFRLNGQPWDDFDDDFYTTDANVDYAIRFITESLDSGNPFFHYIAFNAPHYPLQARKKDIDKYDGRYDEGWDSIREARFKKQKALGLFPEDMKLPPRPKHMTAWAKLPAEKKEWESMRMAVYAAMVDSIDQNIGRMVKFLKDKGLYDNTLIMLCSDNGACPFERTNRTEKPPWKGGTHYTYDASWATVGNTPLRHYKQTQHEGGISTPFIVHWPARLKNSGTWVRSPGHIIDVMATCMDIAGASYPKKHNAQPIEPLQGKSLLPLFSGQQREGHDWLYFQFGSCRALRKGDWKAVSFYGSRWELYNIAEDRCEQNDLAAKKPELAKELSSLWHKVATDLEHAKDKPVKDDPASHTHKSWHRP